MKNIFVIALALGIMSLACSKEDVYQELKSTTIGATLESSSTKATLDEDLQLKWATGDCIQVIMYSTDPKKSYVAWQKDFNLSKGAGKTVGEFTISSGSFDDWVEMNAIYPKFDSNFGNTNVPSTAYIHLQENYTYSDNTTFAPMVSYNSQDLNFKHVGGLVKMKLKNIPPFADKVSMTMDKAITGWFTFDPINAGTSGIIAGSGSGTVSFNVTPSDTKRELTFLFPVPMITGSSDDDKPTITLDVYNGSETLCEKKATKQSFIGRGELLKMKDLDVTPAGQRWVTVAIQNTWGEQSYKLHHWASGAAGSDEELKYTGKTYTKTFGETSYTFMLYVAKISESHLFKVHLGEEWFGGDADATKIKAYLYNNGSNQVVYE